MKRDRESLRRAAIEDRVWRETHPDFRSIGANGIRRLLVLDRATGATMLVPVADVVANFASIRRRPS